MITLAVETSVKQGGCCLVLDGHPIAERLFSETETASELLIETIREMLVRNDRTFESLDRVVVGVGPGSFTGLRVGMIAAKLIAYFLDKPLHLIPSLDVLASAQCHQNRPVITIQNAYRREVYSACYRTEPRLTRISPYQVCDVRQIQIPDEPCVVTGDGLELYEALIRSRLGDRCTLAQREDWTPRAACSDRLADLGVYPVVRRLEIFSAVPQYVRKSEAEIKWDQTHTVES